MTKTALASADNWNNYWQRDQTQTFTRISWSKRRIMHILRPYLKKDGRALDAGCGSGFFSNFFIEEGMHTTALDYAQEALDVAREKTKGRAQLVQSDLVHDSLQEQFSSKFDLIFSDGLLEHFPIHEQNAIVKNWISVLADNGVIVTFVPNKFSPWELIRPFYMPGIKEEPFILSQLVNVHEQNQLSILTRGGLNTFPFAFSPDKMFGSMFGMLLYTVTKKDGQMESKVSVIVPAYNASKTIQKTIRAVLEQNLKPYEVIVVDDGSTDNTAELIRSCQGVHYVFQENAGPATARNTGAKQARGDILFFTDSDCVPRKDWLEKALRGFQEGQTGVVSGSYGIANPEYILARCIHQEILYRHHKLMPQRPKAFGSYNFGVKRSVFEEVRGFLGLYREASGEDNDLSYRIIGAGYDIFFCRDALVDHMHPVKVGKYLKEQYRHGFWRAKMYLDHPHMAKGDDYTFWKDIAEIPLALSVLVLSICAMCFGGSFWGAALIFSLLLFIIEIAFSFVTGKKLFDRIFFGAVLFLRAFARSFGFSTGIVWFFCKKLGKKR